MKKLMITIALIVSVTSLTACDTISGTKGDIQVSEAESDVSSESVPKSAPDVSETLTNSGEYSVNKYKSQADSAFENYQGAMIFFSKPENWDEPQLVVYTDGSEKTIPMEQMNDNWYEFQTEDFKTGKVYFTDGKNRCPENSGTLELDTFLMYNNGNTYDYKTDTDDDSICDYLEALMETEINNPDTDGDGLPDGYELYFGLNPKDKNDASKDSDSDGLTNIEEYKFDTNPFNDDTDNDNLKDWEEVNKYKTDPLNADTDGDGLEDGDEIDMSFDPLKKDTDGNGVIDSEEKVYQTLSLDVNEPELPGVTKAELKFECKGNIKKAAKMTDIYKIDYYTNGVVALVGSPVEIETNQDIEEATITFTYDENNIGSCKEEDLSIMWYDHENDWFYIMDRESVIDTRNHTVTVKTDKLTKECSEKFMLVDGQKWYDVWNNVDEHTYRLYYGEQR